MFVSKGRFERVVDSLNEQLREVRNENWTIRHKYWRLLDHLGLTEYEQQAMTKIRSKDGPEPSE